MFSPVSASSSRKNFIESWEQNPNAALSPRRASSWTCGACPEAQAGSTAGSCQLQGFSEYDLGAPWEARMENSHIINQLNFMT